MKPATKLPKTCFQFFFEIVVLDTKKLINLKDRSKNEHKLLIDDFLVLLLTFITYVNTNSISMWEKLLTQCKLTLFPDSDFTGDLEDAKSTSGGTLCVFGSHTFVPMSSMCQETNFGFAHFNRIRNHFFGCSIEIEIGLPALEFTGSDLYSP